MYVKIKYTGNVHRFQFFFFFFRFVDLIHDLFFPSNSIIALNANDISINISSVCLSIGYLRVVWFCTEFDDLTYLRDTQKPINLRVRNNFCLLINYYIFDLFVYMRRMLLRWNIKRQMSSSSSSRKKSVERFFFSVNNNQWSVEWLVFIHFNHTLLAYLIQTFFIFLYYLNVFYSIVCIVIDSIEE